MARRSVLQEIPIQVPQTEQQSYDVISEEDSPPYNKPVPAARLHARYISNDESKENITPTQLEGIYKEGQLTVLDSVNIGELLGDEPGPSAQDRDGTTAAASMATPEGPPDELPPCRTPLDFSTVTLGDLGISSESFTTKCAGKSPRSLHKHRRRSTIGVRGSPEMNFLIRQIALQRSNRKSEPEPLDNPFPSPRNSILREKISAFRNAFQAVEEAEGKLSFPGFSQVEERQSEKGEEELTAEPPEKRKKVCDSSDLGVTDAPCRPPVTLFSESPQISVPEKTSESDCSLASRLLTEVPSEPVQVQSDESQILPSSSRCRKRKVMFASLISPPEGEPSPPLITESSPGPILKPALKKTPISHFVHFCVGFREENRAVSSQESTNDATNRPEDSIRKRVTFGRELSPELFDKSLPANTPLRRGSTPYRQHTLDATPTAELLPCHSPREPMPQPDFGDRDEEELLQPLTLCFDAESSDCDSPRSSPLPEHKEESGPEEEAADPARSSGDGHDVLMSTEEPAEETADLVNESFLLPPEVSPAETRKTRPSRKRQLSSAKKKPDSNGSKVRSTARKTSKSVIVRKMQVSRGKGQKKRGKSKKPAHSDREIVSKIPLLSPIPELPECGPTPPASTSRGPPCVGKSLGKNLLKKVRAPTRAGKDHLTLEAPQEKNVDEKDPERQTVCVVEDVQTPDALGDPPPEDMKVSEISGDLPGSDVLDLATPVSIECSPSTTAIKVTDDMSKQTNSLPPSSKEKISKSKYTKRRSSTHKYTSHATVTSGWDEGADHTSCKQEASVDEPMQVTSAPSVTSTGSSLDMENASPSKPPITTHLKKSRRSSRNHQVSSILSATTLAEVAPATLPQPTYHSDSSMIDSCLPLDEVLQFPQRENKVRRSMRLRRDSGVIGLSWVEGNGGNDTTGRRKSLNYFANSALPVESAGHSPSKENGSACHVLNIARTARRRTIGTSTIQESVLASDTKQRRSSRFHKAPTITSTGDEVVHSTLAPDVL
ncbi:cell division cycle-associated protein 2 [Eleutherodactylus coqui]|uniref:PP1-binding domain-containing protein n=1 Tax=Eleutherodactylus coqui TaxID=57060 RepID=A0A8J6KDS2_ELECQ|nr:hypothetical protein GDO78_004859 [Eleutherodactylus coqui]